tara:strand:+ start:144 stop:392 length:249 start_codon:yes stop_codon:yes gene_type:complete
VGSESPFLEWREKSCHLKNGAKESKRKEWAKRGKAILDEKPNTLLYKCIFTYHLIIVAIQLASSTENDLNLRGKSSYSERLE